MPHPLNTQFIVADGARARWIVRRAHDFVTQREQAAGPKRHTHPQGVVFASASGQRFNVEARDGAVRSEKAKFAEEVAAAINQGDVAGDFERLVIVAPARVLRVIVDHLTTSARSKFVGSLAKDLTKVPDHELAAWLVSLELQ